jgi:hypothetical protein
MYPHWFVWFMVLGLLLLPVLLVAWWHFVVRGRR